MKDTVEGGPASRLMRWALKLAEYRFTVEHKPGALHKDADGISRLVAHISSSRQTYLHAIQTLNPNTAELESSRKARTKTTTARSLQADERAKRRDNTSQSSILEDYLHSNAQSAQTVANAQQADPTTRDIITFLITGLPSDPMSSDDLRHNRWLLKESNRFVYKDGLLYRFVGPTNEDKTFPSSALRLYVPASLRQLYLISFHEHLCHLGANRMAQVLRARYYWPGQSKDISTHVRECHECTLAKPPFRRPAAPKGPPVGSYPFDRVFVDVVSMAPTHDYIKGEQGYSKLLVFIDSLSRWIEAIPFNTDPTSEQVLHAYLSDVVCRHGTPRELRSDSGSNFVSALTATILMVTGTDLTPTEAHHHEGVGLVERAQQTLVGLARATDEGGAHWADHLHFFLMSMRASPNHLTCQSPASLLYGREIRLPS